MAKNNRNGQAEIWNPDHFKQVMDELNPQIQCVFAICYYTGCRVSEALQLKAHDIVSDRIVFRRATTKTKESREVAIHLALAELLKRSDLPTEGYLFPGQGTNEHLTRQAADHALRKACDRLGFKGYSTHSGRRTVATRLNNAGVPLRTIQKIGGWSSLVALQRYIEVSPEQMVEAIGKL